MSIVFLLAFILKLCWLAGGSDRLVVGGLLEK